jgi:hypothetical protein
MKFLSILGKPQNGYISISGTGSGSFFLRLFYILIHKCAAPNSQFNLIYKATTEIHGESFCSSGLIEAFTQ